MRAHACAPRKKSNKSIFDEIEGPYGPSKKSLECPFSILIFAKAINQNYSRDDVFILSVFGIRDPETAERFAG